MKNKLIHILALPTAYIFWQYVKVWVGMQMNEFRLRPFVYRMLVPELVDILMRLGIPKDISYIIIISLSLIGFIVALKFLYTGLTGQDGWGVAYAASWGLILLIWAYCKPYDIMTAFLMTLSYLFILKKKHLYLILLFPILCVNRETAFLVTVLSAVWFWRKIKLSEWMLMIVYQVATFVLIQFLIHIHYRNYPGVDSHLQLMDNINIFIHSPYLTVALIVGLSIVIGLVAMNWKHKSSFLRTAFLILFPIQFALYLLFGNGYELRVFAEVYPIIFILIYPKEVSHVKESQTLSPMQDNSKGYVS